MRVLWLLNMARSRGIYRSRRSRRVRLGRRWVRVRRVPTINVLRRRRVMMIRLLGLLMMFPALARGLLRYSWRWRRVSLYLLGLLSSRVMYARGARRHIMRLWKARKGRMLSNYWTMLLGWYLLNVCLALDRRMLRYRIHRVGRLSGIWRIRWLITRLFTGHVSRAEHGKPRLTYVRNTFTGRTVNVI